MTNAREVLPDVLQESYSFVRRLTHSGKACVYEVLCTRGRLRGRHLAIKNTPADQQTRRTSAMHQDLSHPNIVALYDVVYSVGFDYSILELCSGGNLQDLLASKSSSMLSDKEVRHIAKDIGAALVYLKHESVIHRNICSSNILLTNNFQAKLCDFQDAVLSETGSVTLTNKFAHATYPAPEVLRPPFRCSFAMDIWAFGCLIVSCLQSSLPTTTLVPLDSECRRMLSGLPSSFQDFVVSLLALDPLERLSAEEILAHPGLNEPSSASASSLSKASSRMACHSSYGFKHTDPAILNSGTATSTLGGYDTPRDVLRNITNTGLRDYILKCSTHSGHKEGLTGTPSISQPVHRSEDCVPPHNHDTETIAKKDARCIRLEKNTAEPSLSEMVPVGTTRPVPLNTDHLSTATHKLAGGSITILSSLSVLVDFRESQRRNGLKGDYVLLIDPSGSPINVYSAPHLSIPSCLIEPRESFAIDDLPPVYWKQYNDTASFLYAVKRRTPQITVHKPGARCIVMSNMPNPDIEVIIYSIRMSASANKTSSKEAPILRIRYSRQSSVLELSEHTTGAKGPEWRKESLSCTDLEVFNTQNSHRLSDTCQKGLRLLIQFLETWDRLDVTNASKAVEPPNIPRQDSRECPIAPLSLSSIRIPSKPQKYPLKISASSNKENKPPPIEIRRPLSENKPAQKSAAVFEDVMPDTRYIAGVGWCVKRPVATDSPKLKYQLMFHDGACLEVNFYSGILTLLQPASGESVKCPISAKSSHPEIERRLIHLKDFMLLYESENTASIRN